MQTLQILIRRRVLLRLICVYTVCLLSSVGMLGNQTYMALTEVSLDRNFITVQYITSDERPVRQAVNQSVDVSI